ncbi:MULTISPECIES: lysozyme inhibitor LprI family protein [unclassified Neorhizobium]|uniref:lysozyme inhibitor LprI family protein n=1 Tax=unclassified Neorhizobium TaxID=2629175 RepID=UPI001FF681C7|nr:MULTISPECIES: hypothetical protein [unclassified Neorhizobium]
MEADFWGVTMWRAVTIALTMLIATSAHAGSFDCKGVPSPDERIVCNDPLLSALDTVLPRVQEKAEKDNKAETRKTLRDFTSDRSACGSDRSCVLSTYIAILGKLGGDNSIPADVTANIIAAGRAKPSPTLPQKIGQCAVTNVTAVHPRVGQDPVKDEDYNSGTGIEYANKGYQVSYAREEALIASKPGDKVTMCLISTPKRCPAGDDRGREYFVTNARTGQSWAMADSQHACGGP